MMKTLLLSAALVAAGTIGSAQAFNGAELGLELGLLNDTEESVTNYYGGVEFSVYREFGVALDARSASTSAFSENSNSITFHGIYTGGPAGTRVGLYFSGDSFDDVEVDVFGAEAGYNFGQGDVEAYIGSGDYNDDEGDLTFFGVEGSYAIGSGFGVIGGFDYISGEVGVLDLTSTKVEIGGTYEVANQVEVFGKVGRLESELGGNAGSSTVDDIFVSFGAEIGFGPNAGLSFSPRNDFSNMPLLF